jgi:effector-binding domain-containing protein
MKILKKIGIGLLVLIALLVVISLFLPSKVHVQRSIMINAPAKTIFHTVNNLKTWINWSYWDRIDPNMKSTFEGPEAGVGAIHRWESENDSVGKGSMTITESVEPTKVLTSLEFSEWVTPGGWLFDQTDEGVRTTIFMDMDMPFYARIPGLFMDKMLGKDFDKTLANLKNYTESLPVEAATTWTVETVTTTPAHVMSMHILSNSQEFTGKMESAYSQIQSVMDKQGLKQAGAMYTVYYKWSKDTVEMEPGIVVNQSGKTDGEVTAAEMNPMKAIKVDHYGGMNTEKAHYFIDEWAKKNSVTFSGPPWEEYVTDSKSEPDTAKWLTRIYYPVK